MVGVKDEMAGENQTRENVLALMEEKTKLETEMRMMNGILEQNGVGLNDPLVDSEGYPRNDIDVYQVRHARCRIICLRNDLKAIMKSIEEGLHAVHSGQQLSQSMETSMSIDEKKDSLEPIARINIVTPDSPADIAGLQTGDLILEFGTVSIKNFKSLDNIAQVVRHSVGSKVDLTIQRGGRNLQLQLSPRPWSGQGVLGCSILPVENIER